MVRIMKKKEVRPITERFFKSKLQMVIYIFLFILLLIGFIYFGSKEYSNSNNDDKFASEHVGANSNSVFKYINILEAYNLVRGEDCILFIGTSNNENVTYYANMLDDVAKSLGIDSISYYDLEPDRSNRNATYESIVNYFSDYITFVNDENTNLHVPTLIVKKDNQVLLFDEEEAFRKGNVSDKDYWANITSDKKFTITSALNDYLGKENE